MTISAVNASYLGAAPVAGGSTTLAFGGTSNLELSYIGQATVVLDGSAFSGQLNYIDGTNALAFTPRAVLASRIGGNAANTVQVYQVDDNGDGISANVRFSAAGSVNNTVKIVFMVMK